MDRHFLIAVSDQKSALHGVRFVSNFFSDKRRIKATLFCSAPKPAPVFADEKSFEAVARQREQQKKILVRGQETMQTIGQECMALGLLKKNLIEKLETQVFSKVADIIQEGEKGSYDAVVIGRRGLSMIESIFEDSVSQALFNEGFTFPLWLCRSSDPSRKNVLLYVDGSAASFRMADHVGFIVGLEKKHRVDLLVIDSIAAQSSLIAHYKDALLKHGVPADMIQTRLLGSGNPGKQILKMVETDTYAAVGLGQTSSETGMLARLFKEPVCSILFKEMEAASLWLCP